VTKFFYSAVFTRAAPGTEYKPSQAAGKLSNRVRYSLRYQRLLCNPIQPGTHSDALKYNKTKNPRYRSSRDAATIKFRYVSIRILQVDNGTFVYAKHGNLVDADASVAIKASTKHLESRLEVIQGHTFWDR